MTPPEDPQSSQEAGKPDSNADAETPPAASEATTPEPEPEPWTEEKVAEWNAYYDLYVVFAVLLLAFVASANKISTSPIWTHLKSGQLIAAKGPFATATDPFSYTEQGGRWVNVPWLFDWSNAMVYKGASSLIPDDPNDPIAASRRADQVGAGALVGLTALVRIATVLVLLAIRWPGPGLWWAALCATFALAAAVGPLGPMLGGLAGPAIVGPDTWGQLFLAIQLLLLHRTINLRRRGAVLGLIPLFLLWANIHESFLIGLVILAAVVVGRLATRRSVADDPFSARRGLLILGACAAVCLVNPSVHRVYLAALQPYIQLFGPSTGIVSSDQLSYFGKGIRMGDPDVGNSLWQSLILGYLLIVTAGLVSFVLNRRRFSLGRFLAYVVAALLWAVFIRLGIVFAVVFAATLTLNGQEWYLDRFGDKGHLGRGWTLLSTGGRFVTILLLFLLSAKCLTGYGRTVGEPLFGFGYNPDEFAFEAADFLRNAKLKQNVLNTTRLQGDALIWRAYPLRQTFIDGRQHVFPQSLQSELHTTRLALAEDNVDVWKPVLDRYKISSVMIEPESAPKTYRALMQSVNWIPFYDDGHVVLFGRADAPATDLAFFKENRLDSQALAYERDKPLPPFDRPPTPMSRLDEVFQNRFLEASQPHTQAAQRWLAEADRGFERTGLPDPAHCFLAIREARLALSRKPDDTLAYRILSACYRDLMVQETALLAGLNLTDDPITVSQIAPQPQLLMGRFRQRATSLNFAIQTTPPPRTETDRDVLTALNLEVYQLYRSVNFLDLARDRLRAALDNRSRNMAEAVRIDLMSQLSMLDDQVKLVSDALGEMVVEQQANPVQRADFAMARGAPGIAIQELEEALQINVNPAAVKPTLIDLYCDTGQPEKALDLLGTSTSIDDPALGAEPGVAALRQGRVYLLLGNYEYAATLWERHSIPQVRLERSFKAILAGLGFVHGELKSAATSFMNLPGKLSTQALWENELGMCRLEAGQPTLAAKNLEHSLTLAPGLPNRLVTAYYLTRLGKTVPPLPKTENASDTPASSTADAKAEKAKEKDGAEGKGEEPKKKETAEPKAEKASEAPKDGK